MVARVVRPGGAFGALEFAVPELQPLRILYLFYFRRLLPRIGSWISGDADAYRYLPESVLGFPQRDDFVARLHRSGFEEGSHRTLSGGILCLYTARRCA